MIKVILILILGSLGGLLAEKAVAPYLFANYPYKEGGTTIINKTEKVVIGENSALEDAIKKIQPSIVLIKAGKISQTGFIFTKDGLILTSKYSFEGQVKVLWQDKTWPARVFSAKGERLFLLKIEADDLPVISLSDDEPRLGQKVFLITPSFVNSGIIKKIEGENISTNIQETNESVLGSPLVNLKGEVIAINYSIIKGEVLSFVLPKNLF